MNADVAGEVLTTLAEAGIQLTLVGQDRIKVQPASRLTQLLRATIRDYKSTLVSYLKSTVTYDLDAAEHDQSTTNSPTRNVSRHSNWLRHDRLARLHTKSLLHHWGCKRCCAAGLGYGKRCKVGLDLWVAYEYTAALESSLGNDKDSDLPKGT